MGNTVIIAEKPSVATSIAKIVGANTSHRDKSCGYLEGNGYQVTWAFGHLVRLMSPEQMGFVKGELPMIPQEWKTRLIGRKDKDGKDVEDPMVKKQMKTIETLFKNASKIIVATDAGREGELIFRYIYEYLNCRTPFFRLWISSLTDEAIKKGLQEIKDGSCYQPLSDAAHARSEADWLVGFNASRAIRLATGFKGTLSLGRVQTPTLGLICQRYEANINFKPTPYWQIQVDTEKDRIEFCVNSENKYNSKEGADSDAIRVRNAGKLTVTEVETKRSVSKPPLLHDLTSLQRQANSKFGLTAEQTLKAAQSLYEKKLISYPRTGSRYIPEDVFRTIPSLLDKISPNNNEPERLSNTHLNKRGVNDSKVTDHHALLPTGNQPDGLTADEKKIYDLIVIRTLEAFGEDSISNVTNITLEAGGVIFKTKGSVPVYLGWKKFGSGEEKDDKDEDDNNTKLPTLKEGDILPIDKAEVVEKSDKPLPIFTDSSLLGEMETCGKKIKDEDVRESMKDCGLGTPATRAATIEALIQRNYVYRNGKKLIPTDLGMQVWSVVQGRKIADVQTTGEWERDLTLVERGNLNVTTFNSNIRSFVLEIIDDLKKNCKSLDGINILNEPTRTCPICGKPMINQRYSIGCLEDKGGCGFKINREIAGKKLPESAINELCSGKKTSEIKGFISKSGKKFNASLKINPEEKKLAFNFGEPKQTISSGQSTFTCPCCSGEVKDTGLTLACSSCEFKLWKKQRGITFTAEQIQKLMSGERVEIHGMISSQKIKYNGILSINKESGKLDCEFLKKKKS